MRLKIIHIVLPIFLPLACMAKATTGHASSPQSATEPTANELANIELAKNTLAKQEKIDVNTLQVESVNTVQWPDSSLGCPEPGMMYGQMITPGYQITLIDSTSKTRHLVHTGKGYAVICKTLDSAPLKTEKNLRFGQRWQLSQEAQKLLAARLSITKNAVRIVGTSTVPSNSANCKNIPTTNLQEIQIIKLSFNGTPYQYAVINNQLVFCD